MTGAGGLTEECHWCASPCGRSWTHDDPPPNTILHGIWGRSRAKRPGNPFLCLGCWLWRRKSITVHFLGGGYKDRETANTHSWWVSKDGALVVMNPACRLELYERLLSPPDLFFLSLLDNPVTTSGVLTQSNGALNLLQCCVLNTVSALKADTPLHFTVNNVPHSYTIYELEQGLIHGPGGREPGAQALIRLLGPPAPKRSEKPEQKVGRRSTTDVAKGRKAIYTSGRSG